MAVISYMLFLHCVYENKLFLKYKNIISKIKFRFLQFKYGFVIYVNREEAASRMYSPRTKTVKSLK